MSPRRYLILLACLSGCGGANVSASATITDQLQDPSALATCARGSDPAASLAIVSDLRDSYHEMIVCGGLALSFDQAIVNVLANAALGRGGPSQLVYQGNGTYATTNGMMMIRATLGDGTGIGSDLLDPQSYLVGITVSGGVNGAIDAVARGGKPWDVVKSAGGSLDIQFRAQGPLFSILGLTADEVRGGRLLASASKIKDAIAEHIHVANRIDVTNQYGGTSIHYILEGAPQPLKGILDHKAVPMQLSSIVATNATTGQTMKVTEWTMQFKGDGGTVLDGAIAMDVDGGPFPYAVRFDYPHRKDPDVRLSCR
jgi:hypothetical protein